jgi:intracellular sulfur oxidation DsrE/DsrF family protein
MLTDGGRYTDRPTLATTESTMVKPRVRLRKLMMRLCCWPLASICAFSAAIAGPADFHAGKIIPEYGRVATVPNAPALAAGSEFKVVFDVSEAAETGKINRQFESAARFLNMHGEAGVAPTKMHLAIVVHGAAAMDLVNDAKYGASNANAGLIAALSAAGVDIGLCGQTAAYRDIGADDLLPGVKVSLSAMTLHAQWQQRGYTLNPF